MSAEPGADALTIKYSSGEMVACYQAAVVGIRAAFAALDATQNELHRVFDGQIWIPSTTYSGHAGWDNPDAAIEHVRRQVWYRLVERLELRRMLSIERWTALERDLDKGALPDITEANVAAFFAQYAGNINGMVKEMVVEVYEWLRPREHARVAKLKTNGRFEVGPRVIVGHMLDLFQVRWKTWSVGYRDGQKLVALERAFNALDGRGKIGKTYNGQLWDAINVTPWETARGETDLFRFRLAKNGNLHIEFKRLDLLARFNQVAGGKRLKGGDAS